MNMDSDNVQQFMLAARRIKFHILCRCANSNLEPLSSVVRLVLLNADVKGNGFSLFVAAPNNVQQTV